MSEFLGEARVVIRPDTTRFRAQLQEEVRRAISQTQSQIPPVQIPVALGAAAGLAANTAATGALTAAQATAIRSTSELDTINRVANTSWARQAVLLEAVSAATLQKAGADSVAGTAARAHAVAQSQVGKAAVASTAGMLGLRGAVLTAGTAFIAATVGFQALGKAIGSAISFERELNVFQVTAGATADQMERVQEVSRELGRDITLPGVAANDAAETLSLLARAGLSVENSLNAVRGTLQLATAAEIENAEAATLVANALNSFKLDGTEAARVADLLAGAANASQGSISDMGLALRQVSAIASGLGVSVEDTITLLTQLSRAGLSSSDAGTSLRQTFLRLIQALPKVDDEVEKLGLDLRDMNGNIRPQVFEELGRKLKTLTPAARQLAIANLGGADAIRTLLVLTRAQAGEFDAVKTAVTEAGLAQDLAAARTKGLGGDVEAAKNQFADLGLTIGKVASGPLSLMIRTAGAAAGAVNELNRELGESAGGQGFGEAAGNFFNRFAETFARLNISFQEGVRRAQAQADTFDNLAAAADRGTDSIGNLVDELNRLGSVSAAAEGDPSSGLNVQGILNRVQGLESGEVRARISGDNQAIIDALEEEQAFLEAQLDRQFVKNRPGLRRQLEQALLGTTNDLASIASTSASEAKRAAGEAARAVREADQAILDALSQRREDAERRVTAAADTEGVRDDIRRQNELQALIKQQIEKVRGQVRDEKTRTAAIRELRQALIDSRREEDALRKQRREDEAERRRDAIEARAQSLELDIELADINENDARSVALRRKRIAQLKREAKLLNLEGNALKENRNERARIRKEIEGILAEEKKTSGQSAQQFFFEQLQAQQGFASNLLGNLIPSDQTAGLVGVPAPTTQLGAGIDVAASVQQGKKDGGPSAGQANTTNALLERILEQLKTLNGANATPEASRQRRVGAGSMDNTVM